ncbi:YqaE/Pmp3 family membrane protein [Kordiimonas gwangyangensis]|uniref:YqaE/Pmp3 family membrane protein n=1 Tax=Kordiimonas gwangyangensis TaxID=288022 RepID=UPI00037D2227|nr:YqaE/Pmp3 family membrane protein [Kordiimonas gwangyangensis]
MRLILAIIFPPLVFFTINRPFQGLMNLILWITFIGWPVAAIWAVYALSQYRNDELRREFDDERRYGRYSRY